MALYSASTEERATTFVLLGAPGDWWGAKEDAETTVRMTGGLTATPVCITISTKLKIILSREVESLTGRRL
ncbi:unnamed protein product [Linum trigynum]|uniref:Uncharacterized protein n=1 Tax=Linum trigynum TaxID=586398 RepID=A0AAV2C626_9ROSI